MILSQKSLKSLDDVDTNEKLYEVIYAVQDILGMFSFLGEEEINSFFGANLLLFNNLHATF